MKRLLVICIIAFFVIPSVFAGQITSSTIVTTTANTQTLYAKWLGGTITDSSGYNFNGKTGINHTLSWNNLGNVTPLSNNINWYVNGSYVSTGTSYTLNRSTAGTYTIKCSASYNGFNFETSQNYVISTKPYLQASVIGGGISGYSNAQNYYVSYMNGTYYMLLPRYADFFSSSNGTYWNVVKQDILSIKTSTTSLDWTKAFVCGNNRMIFFEPANDKLFYSSDGVNWTQSTSFTSVVGVSGSTGCNLFFCNGKFYAIIEGRYDVYESTYGDTWNKSFTAPIKAGIFMYSNGKYVLLNTYGSSAYISTNLVSWSYIATGISERIHDGIGVSNGRFVLRGIEKLYVTDDFKTWTTCSCNMGYTLASDGSSVITAACFDANNVSNKYTFYLQ